MEKPTLLLDLISEDYHARPEASKHDLDMIRVCPEYYRWHKDHAEESTSAALIFGSLYHTYILEPHRVDLEFFVMPDINRKTNAGKEEYARLSAEAGKRHIIKREDLDKVFEMKKALLANPLAAALLEQKVRFAVEPSFFWHDRATGVECRARADLVTKNGFIVDLKTTMEGGACLDKFTKDAFSFDYHRQAAHYLRGWETMRSGEGMEEVPGVRAFVFIAQEKEAPYLSAVHVASPTMLKLGAWEIHQDLKTLQACQKSGKWPGLQKQAQEVSLPAWVPIPDAAEIHAREQLPAYSAPAAFGSPPSP